MSIHKTNGILLNDIDHGDDVNDQQIYMECELDTTYGKHQYQPSITKQLRNKATKFCTCSGGRIKNILLSVFPILTWLPKYDVKNNLLGDMAAGLTVGVVHIPQGLAYGLLATLPPIVGIYVSFFPVLLYPIFGTSRHISMGTFAVVSILVSAVLDQRVPASYCGNNQVDSNFSIINSTLTTTNFNDTKICLQLYEARKIEVATSLSLCVGLLQVVMHIFNLGIVTVFLSDSLISGFVSGASIHVITSQVPKLFGVAVQRYSGPLALVYTYIDFFRNISTTNLGTILISTICIIFLVAGKEINLRYKKKLPIPIPWELGIVILSTIASHFGKFEVNHNVVVVGEIPTGIITSIPNGNDVVTLFLDAIPIAVVAFTVEISLCQIFATKHAYEVNSNQELLALGLCNIFGSFFSCFPSAASLSRSVIYEEIDGKTQLGAYMSSAVVLAVLLWIGPLFQPLPQAALAVIIIVNIKSIALMWKNVKPLWRISHIDAITWIVAWFSVVLLGVDLGLIVGATFSLFTVIYRTRNATGNKLEKVTDANVYRDSNKYVTTSEDHSIFIFQFTDSIYFANKDRFAEQLYTQLGFDPIAENARRMAGMKTSWQKKRKRNNKDDAPLSVALYTKSNNTVEVIRKENEKRKAKKGSNDTSDTSEVDGLISRVQSSSLPKTVDPFQKYSFIILDMCQCSFIDSDGAKLIRELYDSLQGLRVKLMLASCNVEVKSTLKSLWKDRQSALYISLESAVKFVLNQQQLTKAESRLASETYDETEITGSVV